MHSTTVKHGVFSCQFNLSTPVIIDQVHLFLILTNGSVLNIFLNVMVVIYSNLNGIRYLMCAQFILILLYLFRVFKGVCGLQQRIVGGGGSYNMKLNLLNFLIDKSITL